MASSGGSNAANKLEKFVPMRVNRRQLKGAPYNPRTITKEAEKKLRKSLRDFGMLAPITWNETTGNVVAGHQRLSIMDSILKKPDYELTVAAVRMPPEEEVKANVIMNNPSIMGEWDHDKMAELHMDFPEIDFKKDLGFEKFDIDLMFAGTGVEEDIFLPSEEQAPVKEEIERMNEIDAIKRAKTEHRQKASEDNATGETNAVEKNDYMITFVFPNNTEKHEFCERIGIPRAERYAKHTKLFDIQDGKLKAYG